MLPTTIVDCHHHFLAPDEPFHATLKEIGAPAYTAEAYALDCGTLPITKTVHGVLPSLEPERDGAGAD